MLGIANAMTKDMSFADPDEDPLLAAALRRQQRRTHPNNSDGLFSMSSNSDNNFGGSSPNPPNINRIVSSKHKGFIAEVSNTAAQRRPSILLFDDDMRIGRSSAPLAVRAECNGMPTVALIDCTSIISTITTTMVSQLGLHREVIQDITPPTNLLAQPGAARMTVEGALKYVEITLGACKLVSKFFVLKEASLHIILGLDFLRKVQATISLSENALHVGHGTGQSKINFLGVKELSQAARATTNSNMSFACANGQDRALF